ncbi:hypothetical protein [Duganella qianjiadongensis]|uniref:Protein kinase domain-containing protein n=1 Tax=Duganella qianjiadongensis TaxID=2692176 RepID=A0ABW9VG18_9BURK|nr:hypothetical protein [Duganella qianjiadongensis]MYM38556.1 hypothetical protein [Duganella qianjiadongensis]
MPTLSHVLRFGYALSRQSLRTDAPKWAQQRCATASSDHARCANYQPPPRWNLLGRVRCAFSDDATRAMRAAGRWNACYDHDDAGQIALEKLKLSAATPEQARAMVAALSPEACAKLVKLAQTRLQEFRHSPLLAELEQCVPLPSLSKETLGSFELLQGTAGALALRPGESLECTRRSGWEVSSRAIAFLRNLKSFHQAGYIYHDISLSRIRCYMLDFKLVDHPGISCVPFGQIQQAKAHDERQALIAIYQSYYGDDQLKNIGEFLRALGIVFHAQKRVAQFMRDPHAQLDNYIGDLTYSQKPGRAVWD